MSQAKTAAQARWRARSPTHRVEVHLPAETVEILDALARAAGLSRTGLIERLIAAAAEPPRKEAPARVPEPGPPKAASERAPPLTYRIGEEEVRGAPIEGSLQLAVRRDPAGPPAARWLLDHRPSRQVLGRFRRRRDAEAAGRFLIACGAGLEFTSLTALKRDKRTYQLVQEALGRYAAPAAGRRR